MSEPQKRKWLEISKNYSALTPQGQATLNSRMNEWVALSPQQRAQARLNFGKTKELSRQLTPEEKKAKWEAYQALSPEEKQKLAAIASPKPRARPRRSNPWHRKSWQQYLHRLPASRLSSRHLKSCLRSQQPHLPAAGPTPASAPQR